MTPELHDDLINFSFHKLQDVFKNYHTPIPDRRDDTLLTFLPCLLADLKQLVWHRFPLTHEVLLISYLYSTTQSLSESDHICRTFQVHFDGVLCNVLEKYHHSPGFALLLGSLLQYITVMNINEPIVSIALGITASLYFVRQQRGHILDDVGFSGFGPATSRSFGRQGGTDEFFAYFAELLDNPGRSGINVFDQQRYATAAKECLELCLCSHRNFSKGAIEFACDQGLRRSKPWAWIARLGAHSRIRNARQHVVRQQKLRTVVDQYASLPKNSLDHEYYRSLAYRWALDLLPFLLEKSDVSLELAEVLHSRSTFTTMAQRFPRRKRLAKEAITKYLLRVESAVGDS